MMVLGLNLLGNKSDIGAKVGAPITEASLANRWPELRDCSQEETRAPAGLHSQRAAAPLQHAALCLSKWEYNIIVRQVAQCIESMRHAFTRPAQCFTKQMLQGENADILNNCV